jgi:hypothetical protein
MPPAATIAFASDAAIRILSFDRIAAAAPPDLVPSTLTSGR